MVKELGIEVVPYHVHTVQGTLRDGVDMPPEAFYEWVKTAPEWPTTANPSAGEYLEAYRRAAQRGDSIVEISITGTGSGGYQSAVLAKRLLEQEMPGFPVEVVDTQQVAMAHGWAVIQAARAALPLYLSEKSVIGAAGLARVLHPTTFAWFEAGRAYAYGEQRFYEPRFRWDARGGVSLLKGWGQLQQGSVRGWFHELNLDGVYASRFRHDLLVYAQNRSGYTLPASASGLQAQVYGVWNLTADRRGEYWGNFAEAGLGLRLRGGFLAPGMSWRAEFVRGAHLRNELNPWGPNYWDFRVGIWYAHTRY
jgi:hypothetical protein